MKYDFTTLPDRAGKDAIAYDSLGSPGGFAPESPIDGFDPIPMWVADMNFATAPSIQEAIRKRLEHPLYGYFNPRKEYYDAIIQWQLRRNCVDGLRPEYIGYENGVLGGVMSALSVFCSPGEKILVHSPTYIGFTNSLRNGGYRLIHSPLQIDCNGIWRMDYADMEEKLKRHNIHTAIICSPHNPTGRVWERSELEEAMRLFEKYQVKVISDEIWSDLTLTGFCHIPTQIVSEYARNNTVALYAPSKTFNLAGLVGSYHIIYDPYLRQRVRRQASICHYNEMNVLSMYALIGGYSPQGEEWLEELRQVLTENVDLTVSHIRERFEGVSCARPQGTYMLFADCTEWCRQHQMDIEKLEHRLWQVGASVQDGRMFRGPCHVRMNLALPKFRLQDALERMEKYVFCAGKGEE